MQNARKSWFKVQGSGLKVKSSRVEGLKEYGAEWSEVGYANYLF